MKFIHKKNVLEQSKNKKSYTGLARARAYISLSKAVDELFS